MYKLRRTWGQSPMKESQGLHNPPSQPKRAQVERATCHVGPTEGIHISQEPMISVNR